MQLNGKFLQILFTNYISSESINFGDSNKAISIFSMSKIQFYKQISDIFLEYIFASTTTTNKDGERKSASKMWKENNLNGNL